MPGSSHSNPLKTTPGESLSTEQPAADSEVMRTADHGTPAIRRRGARGPDKKKRTRRRTPIEERFWRFVKVNPETGCHEWTGSGSHGYGTIGLGSVKEGKIGAHVLALRIEGNDVPSGMLVMHKCDNRACVNPGHLTIGEDQDNAFDKAAKNRGTEGRGELPYGVARRNDGYGFRAKVKVFGRQIHIGSNFDTPEQAAIAAAAFRKSYYEDRLSLEESIAIASLLRPRRRNARSDK